MRPGFLLQCLLLMEVPMNQIAKNVPSIEQLIKQLISGELMPKEVGILSSHMSVKYLQNLLRILDKNPLPSWMLPDAEDLPPSNRLENLLNLNRLTLKDVANMKPLMSPRYLLDVIIRCDGNRSQLMTARMKDSEVLPSVDELIKLMQTCNLTLKDVVSMMPRMPFYYLLRLKLSLEDELLQQVMPTLAGGDQQVVMPRGNACATSDISKELDRHRLLPFLVLGVIFFVFIGLLVIVLIKLHKQTQTRLPGYQKPADNPTEAMERHDLSRQLIDLPL